MASVTFQGKELQLEGPLPKVGDNAPDFVLTSNSLEPVTLKDFTGKTLALVTVPSLDTPVCDVEARHFNEEAAKLSDNVRIVVVSRDLPFAQARWCGAANIRNVQTLSDYLERDFGKRYGVAIEKLGLLARAIFVVDAKGILTYGQLVPEVTHEPDYAAAIEAIKKAAK